MKAYVVSCHPDPESFTAAVFGRTVEALRSAGHEVRVCDLYADGYEPGSDVTHFVESLRWCEAMVLVYPTWWSGQPALLSAWLEALFEPAGRPVARLGNVRRLITITTHGSSRFVNRLEGEIGRRVVGRVVRGACHRLARTTWIAMYDLDRSTPADRQAFLDRVGQRINRL